MITHKQQFEIWQDHFNRLKDISECCHLFEKCTNPRMYLGFAGMSTLEMDIPNYDSKLAKRIAAHFPTYTWQRRDSSWRIDYVGTAPNGLQIHLHYVEDAKREKSEVTTDLDVPVFCPECEQEKEDDGKRLCPECIEANRVPDPDPRAELMDARRDDAFERRNRE